MKAQKLHLEGLLLIELAVFADTRGHFTEWYKESTLRTLGIPNRFVQDNFSRSAPGVVRGLHFQYDQPQGKLVGVARGQIVDVVVDIRADSPTFGHHLQVQLNDRQRHLLWVPAGFAHGFAVIGNEHADLFYKTDAEYNSKGESGIRWNDPDLAIPWPVEKALVSPRDEALGTFAEYQKSPKFR
ncbi:MAG: dTDP-4-dehydrorhamnose 3,5-epimerase [Bdellovibrionaceae bacterium]|nr:dTDP-4-dehydrorhamnose 3,5-epimerase [Pseudobdellovibrionaceae bacterium]